MKNISLALFASLMFSISLLVQGQTVSLPDVPFVPDIPPTPSSSGNTYYVAHGGKNLPGYGISEGMPWKTIHHAVQQLSAGDTLIVLGSETPYNEWVEITNSGNEDNWITVRGEESGSGHRATLNIRFTISAEYVVLEGLDFESVELTDPTKSDNHRKILLKSGSNHVVVRGINIDCQQNLYNLSGVWVESGVSDVWFSDMDITGCGYKKMQSAEVTDCAGICIKHDDKTKGQIDNISFINVSAHHNIGDGFSGRQNVGHVYFTQCSAMHNSADGFDIGGDYTVFINNVSAHNGKLGDYEHQGTAYKLWGEEVWLVGNLSYNNRLAGAFYRPYVDSTLYALHNTFSNDASGMYAGLFRVSDIKSLDVENQETSMFFYNNIFNATNTKSILIEGVDTMHIAGEGNNDYFLTRDPQLPRYTTETEAIHYRISGVDLTPLYSTKRYTYIDVADPGGLWRSDNAVLGLGFGNVGTTNELSGELDPGFVNINDANFRLESDSDAVNGGIDVGARFDLDGVPIPQGGSPDMGAYELIP